VGAFRSASIPKRTISKLHITGSPAASFAVNAIARDPSSSLPTATNSLYIQNATRNHVDGREKKPNSSGSALNLFFRSADSSARVARRQRQIAPEALDTLKSPTVTFPFVVQFENVNHGDGDTDSDTDNNNTYCHTENGALEEVDEEIIVRLMTPNDLEFLIPLCLEEFGNGNSNKSGGFPWTLNPKKIAAWWEQFCFEKLISFTLRLKMKTNQQLLQQQQLLVNSSEINDPAMLVLSERRPSKGKQGSNTAALEHGERVVGMVELSLQPPNFNRNPPAIPLPLKMKETLALQTELGTLQGWITNLLIDPARRGLKYSKILMTATEGIAKGWGCQFIFLHADADIRSGKIPQRLYESLGYQVVTGHDKEEYAWAGTGLDHFSSIRMVDGAALLCYSKRLVTEAE